MPTISADEERAGIPAKAKNSYGSVPNIDSYEEEEQTDEVSYQQRDNAVSLTKILYSWKSGVVLAAVGAAVASVAIFSPSHVLNKGLIPSSRNMDTVATVNMTALDEFTYPRLNATYSISTMGVKTEVGFTTIGKKCNKQKDCSDGTYCNTQLEEPAKKFCYECINSNHCPAGEYCNIDKSNAECDKNDVTPLPSIISVTRGYNIFDADPLLTKPNANWDDGFSKRSFYRHAYSDRKILLQDKSFDIPVGFEAFSESSSVKTATTQSISSTTSFQTSVAGSVSFGGSGVIRGVELENKVAASAYISIQDDVSMDKMTTESMAYYSLYRFTMSSLDGNKDLKLTDQADAMLSGMTDTSDSWEAFFEEFGTHIIIGGVMGAFERFSASFNSEQREYIASGGVSFEKEVSVGMPYFFSFSSEAAIEASKTVGIRIADKADRSKVVVFGSQNPPEDLTQNPGMIQKELELICLFIDYKKYTNIEQTTCLRSMKDYCITKLNEFRLGKGGSCEYADDKTFQCFTDENCNQSQICEAHQCVKKECFKNDDCPRPDWDTCNERGICVRKTPVQDLAGYCTKKVGDLLDDEWTDCESSPECPSGFVFDRYENGPCWFGTTRKVCHKYKYYYGPPCKSPLLGNCGGGKIGNGCCYNGAYCSPEFGWCGWSKEHLKMRNPSRNECKKMTGL